MENQVKVILQKMVAGELTTWEELELVRDDWFNCFLTFDDFMEFYGLGRDEASMLTGGAIRFTPFPLD